MSFWLRVTLLYLVAAGALLWIFDLDWRIGLDLLIVAAAFVPAILRHSPRLFLGWNRVRYYLLNIETAWDMNLRLQGTFNAAHVERFVHRLALEHPGETEVLQSGSSRFLLRYRRLFTVELVLGPSDGVALMTSQAISDEPSELTITVFEQQVSYRRSRAVLETLLIPLVEQLRNEFTPRAVSYSLRVRFDGTNPFFGMYLQQLRPDLVNEFHFEFRLPLGRGEDYVRVGKEKLVVTSTTVEGFRQGVLAGLTFSSVGH